MNTTDLRAASSPPALGRGPLAAALFLGATALAGCGGDGDDPNCAGCDGPPTSPEPSSSCVAEPPPATAPAIVPGVSFGSGSFSELSEGMLVERQSGGQGGSHVDLSARTFVEGGSDLFVEFEIEGTDWTESAMAEHASCTGEWSQATGRVFDPPSGNVTLRVYILDGNTELATTELPVVIQ